MASSTALMVADIAQKDVVYSTECFDQSTKSLDANTQLLVEYPVMTLEAKYIAPGDWHDVHKYADATLEVINGCLKLGAAYATFTFPPAAPVLLAIAGVGDFIQTVMNLIPDNRPDPIVKKFKKLEKAIHELETKMVAQFADMQSFITEHNFNVNITADVSVLMSYLRDCLNYQDEQDVENFGIVYKQKTPLTMAYSMAYLLKNDDTNPLKMAMAKENIKTKATFNKWKTIVTGILGELVFIEAFASGLLKQKTKNLDLIVDQWNEVTMLFEKWENEYKENQNYWKDFKKFLVPYIESHTHLNNYQKADEIEAKLDAILTSDSFYIFVTNETAWEKNYYYLCPNENDQIIGAWRKGRCNAFVYRSRTGGKKDQKAYDKLKEQLWDFNSRRDWENKMHDILYDQVIVDLEHEYGFYCLMDANCDQTIRYVNHLGKNYGPGDINSITSPPFLHKRLTLIVSFE